MSERELTPDEEAEISRLLADAASPVTMPAEVTARLDDVLAGLVAEREAAAPVVPLKPRRWPQLLVAAAAVSLVGFVGANFVQQQNSGSADFSGAAPEAASQDGAENNDRGGAGNGAESPTDGLVTMPQPSSAPTFLGDAASRLATLKSLSESVQSAAGDFTFDRYAYAATCGLPRRHSSVSYEVNLSQARRAVVTVQRVNANAAKVYVYACGQSVVPVSARLVLGFE